MKISNIIKSDNGGTNIQGLVSGAKQLGLTIRTVKVKIEDIFDDHTLPAIAQVQTKGGGSDFVSIDKDENIIIIESEHGLQRLEKAEFEKMFPEFVILLMPKKRLNSKLL